MGELVKKRETKKESKTSKYRACYILHLLYNSLNRQAFAGGTGRMQR
jgi:hypothetical protein